MKDALKGLRTSTKQNNELRKPLNREAHEETSIDEIALLLKNLKPIARVMRGRYSCDRVENSQVC